MLANHSQGLPSYLCYCSHVRPRAIKSTDYCDLLTEDSALLLIKRVSKCRAYEVVASFPDLPRYLFVFQTII